MTPTKYHDRSRCEAAGLNYNGGSIWATVGELDAAHAKVSAIIENAQPKQRMTA